MQKPSASKSVQAVTILREATDWLSARGVQQWKHWHSEIGERVCGELLIFQESAIRHTQVVVSHQLAKINGIVIQSSSKQVLKSLRVKRLGVGTRDA